MKIVLAGIIARYPFGGVTWCSLMYLLGLRDLGHEVFYIEDTGECIYDPVQNARTEDPGYGTAFLARVVGEKKAREIWYLNKRYSGQEAVA